MFYFRINKLKILNNREAIGKAEVQLISFITTGDTQLPALSGFMDTIDSAEKKRMITEAVSQVVSSRVMIPVHNIRDKHQLFFGDAGYVLYQTQAIPQDFNWQFVAIELDDRTRDNAALVSAILTDDTIENLVSAVTTIAAVSNPVIGAVTVIVQTVAEKVAEIFKNDRDDMIGLMMMSLNRREHYLHGSRDKQDVPDLTGNMFVDYSIFGFEDSVE
ncbi:MAG: hypothetical protein GC178_10220 [Flavobacteriales bacterium]|nr:hypothetical protein [Flavobacteriales bacterium]